MKTTWRKHPCHVSSVGAKAVISNHLSDNAFTMLLPITPIILGTYFTTFYFKVSITLCVYGVYVCMHVWRPKADFAFHLSFVIKSLLLNLELTISARLAGLQCCGCPYLYHWGCRHAPPYLAFTCVLGACLGPYANTASTFPTKPSLQPIQHSICHVSCSRICCHLKTN